MFCFSFSCIDLLHGNCLLTRFNFSIKILLAKITFLFWILLCYLLNMSSFCIGSISWCCFVVPLFRCSFHVPLCRSIPIVSPVFRCFAGVSVFRQCSGVPPVFRRCSVFRSSVSGVPGLIVCLKKSEDLLFFTLDTFFFKMEISCFPWPSS